MAMQKRQMMIVGGLVIVAVAVVALVLLGKRNTESTHQGTEQVANGTHEEKATSKSVARSQNGTDQPAGNLSHEQLPSATSDKDVEVALASGISQRI